jgi:hypothetical protein
MTAATKPKAKSKTTAQDVPSFAIIACPMTKCEVRHVAGVGVLVRFHYIERAEQFENGKHTTLQLLLDPEQGVEIEDAFQKSAQALKFSKALKQSLKALKTSTFNNPSQSLLALAAQSAVQVQDSDAA